MNTRFAQLAQQQRCKQILSRLVRDRRRILTWAVPVMVAGLGMPALAAIGRRADRRKGRPVEPADGSRRPAVQESQQDGSRSRLAYDRVGQGEPLVLLHGLGLSRRSWDPVIARLAAERDVIAVDLPGHGDSPDQPRGDGWSPVDQAAAVTQLLDQLGLDTAHVAGNSTGGWVALELGRSGRAQTVTALSPAGLWGWWAPVQIRMTMRQVRLNAKVIRRLAPGGPRTKLTTAMVMAQSTGHPFHVPDELARRSVHDMAAAPGFGASLRALERRGFRDGAAIHVPVTVAFGSRDRVLLPFMARRRKQLPPQTRWLRPSSLGHIPMFDDPEAVAAILLEASSSSAAVGAGATTR
jgi:pimeloyl-ACP methyl ester carboxylesterase